jgi:hypothetical protein
LCVSGAERDIHIFNGTGKLCGQVIKNSVNKHKTAPCSMPLDLSLFIIERNMYTAGRLQQFKTNLLIPKLIDVILRY